MSNIFEGNTGEIFAEDAQIKCIGAPVKDAEGNVVGRVISYQIIDGELHLTMEIHE